MYNIILIILAENDLNHFILFNTKDTLTCQIVLLPTRLVLSLRQELQK